MQSSQLSNVCVVRPAAWGTVVGRGLAAAAAILVLCSTACCMVEAMYAVPIALDGAASTIARALPPIDEAKYIVHTPHVPPGEPMFAKAPAPQVTAPALADAAKRPQPATQIPATTPQAQPTSPAAVAESPIPMPALSAGALARRSRT